MPSEASIQSNSGSEDECLSIEYSNSTRSSGEYESSTSDSESSNYETASSRSSGSSGSSSSRSSSSGSSSEESSSSDSSSEESSESDAAEFEVGRNEFLRKRLLHGMTSSPMDTVPDEYPQLSSTILLEGCSGQVEEAASVGDIDVGKLDISSIQDEYYADLDESELGFQQPSARGQVHLCETPETSYDFNQTD